ncbi:hypothetical protein [Vibrio breoganii]|uniref:hypothetical protein n=1 Tax=Vibrio breoganii TaxID=553239 RepID=UPI00105685B1|nr:hypothetical protein [Vibrio breoganii]
MDEGLISKFLDVFPTISKSKVDFITFGVVHQTNKTDKVLLTLLQKVSDEYKYVAWSAGHYSDKTVYVENTIQLAKLNQNTCFVLVVNSIPNNIKEKLLQLDNIRLISERININEAEIAPYVSYFWRAYDDFSIPYSVFHAVEAGKKTITLNVGFFSEFVENNNIGYVLDSESNVESYDLKLLTKEDIDKFKSKYNWQSSTDKILSYFAGNNLQ